jgi:hypothetical protein
MKTFYIPVHYYEQESADDLVMVIAQSDIDDDAMQSRIERIKNHYLKQQNNDSDQSEIIDAIFDEVVEGLNGIWSYCKTLPQVVVGTPEERASITGNLKAVSIDKLAHLLIRLQPGDNLYFYEKYTEDEGILGHIFCSTMIKKYESYVIYINCRGGGLPFVADITTYYQDLKQLKAELKKYFKNMDNIGEYVYVDSSFITEDFCDE